MMADEPSLAPLAAERPPGVSPPFPWSELALCLGGLSGASVSAALCLAQLALGPRRAAFLTSNNSDPEVRTTLLVVVLAAAFVPLFLSLPPLVRRGREAVSGLTAVARLLAPLLVVWAVPMLFTLELATGSPITYLLLLLVSVLGLERLLCVSLAAVPGGWSVRASRTPLVSPRVQRLLLAAAVVTASAAYTAYTAYYSILQHWRFQTSGYDLGIYTSLIENLLAGNGYRSTILNPSVSYLSHHAEFGAAYLTPVYVLSPHAETLLVLQSMALGGAAIPLYAFAATQLPRGLAALIAITYLLYAPLHGPNFYDFHWMPMTLPLWFTLFYGVATRRWGFILPAIALVLPMREETGLMLGMLGFVLFATGYWPRVGLAFGVLGVTWFLVMRFVVIPSFGDAGFAGIYVGLVAAGEHGFASVAKTLLINPSYVWKTLAVSAKLKFVLHLLAPLGFLPLRRPLFLVLLLPGAMFTLLTTDYSPTVSISFQYTTHWIPWVFLSSILVMRGLERPEGRRVATRAATLAVVFGIVCHSYAFGAVLERSNFVGGFRKVEFGLSDRDRQRYRSFRALADKVPRGAVVATTDPQSPHMGAWREVCTLRITHCNAEYLLISAREFSGEDRRNATAVVRDASFGLVERSDDFYLLKRGHVSAGTEKALGALRLR